MSKYVYTENVSTGDACVVLIIRNAPNPTFYLTIDFRVLEAKLCKEFFRAMKNLQTSLLLIADVCLIGIIGIIVA